MGAIGQSARSTDRAALLNDQIMINWSRSNRSIAQQSVDRATIGRSRNDIFARMTDCATSIFSRYQRIAQERLCAIYRSCRNGFARSTDSAGKVLRAQPIVQEKFCAIYRSCRNGFARSTDRAGKLFLGAISQSNKIHSRTNFQYHHSDLYSDVTLRLICSYNQCYILSSL